MKRFIVTATLLLCGCGYIPGTQDNLKKRAAEVLSDTLFDPDSAQYRRLKAIDYPGDKKESVICGEVNAKNKMGAYVGYSRFMASEDARTVVVDPKVDLSKQATTDAEIAEVDQQRAFDATWPPCDGKPLPKASPTPSDDEYERRLEEQANRLEALANSSGR